MEAQHEDPDERRGVHLDEHGPDDHAGGEQQPHDPDQDALPALWCDPDEAHGQQSAGGENAGLHVHGED
jgi:hypothetical protein